MKIIHTSTKRKKKPKPNAQQRQLQEEWEKLQAKHSKPLEKGIRGKFTEPDRPVMELKAPPGREQKQKIPSRSTAGGSAAKVASPQYSGTAMLGIGQLHKSNGIPVFSKEDAVDIAKMRRG